MVDNSAFVGSSDVHGGSNATRKPKVSYYYDEDFAVYQVSDSHPIKPLRIKMTDTLIKGYRMDEKMKTLAVDEDFVQATDLTVFHSDDYIDCLKNISVDQQDKYADHIAKFCFTMQGGDCPVFDHMYDYC